MLCPKCKKERDEKDFLKKDLCYKCTYKAKKKLAKLYRKCKICNELLPKGKWAYCSPSCAKSGKNKNKHWTTKVKNTEEFLNWRNVYFRYGRG